MNLLKKTILLIPLGCVQVEDLSDEAFAQEARGFEEERETAQVLVGKEEMLQASKR